MTRTEIIQVLINKTNGKNYLEIGMGPGTNFSQIQCENKVCVDPTPTVPVTFTLTSDEFFSQNKDKFDVVFIDGMHHCENVLRDFNNSLNKLTKNGFIFIDDCIPLNYNEQLKIPIKHF